MADHGGAVIECAVHADRQADDGDELERFACAENVPQALLGGIQQRLLQKQVRASIAGEPKLRENGKRRAVLRGLLHGGDRFLRIIGAVCHAQCGGACRPSEIRFHKGVVLSVAVLIPIIIPQTAARNKGGFGGKSKRLFDKQTLLQLLLQRIEFRRGEEFTECDAETVAEQLDRQNFRVLALAVENVLQA